MDPKDNKAVDSTLIKHFEETKRFTEEVLKENERLRLVNANLRSEIRELENKYISVEVARVRERLALTEDENRLLRNELRELKDQYSSVEKENWEFSQRYIEVERQNSNLVNMYVASYRLHSTLDFPEVVAIIKEIVINMIGSEYFDIYLLDRENESLVLAAHMGPIGAQKDLRRPIGTDKVGEIVQNGQTYVRLQDEAHKENAEYPVACIPLKSGDNVRGIIVIHELLVQKDELQPVDYELFELLANHATTALFGSYLFTDTLNNNKLHDVLQNMADEAKPLIEVVE